MFVVNWCATIDDGKASTRFQSNLQVIVMSFQKGLYNFFDWNLIHIIFFHFPNRFGSITEILVFLVEFGSITLLGLRVGISRSSRSSSILVHCRKEGWPCPPTTTSDTWPKRSTFSDICGPSPVFLRRYRKRKRHFQDMMSRVHGEQKHETAGSWTKILSFFPHKISCGTEFSPTWRKLWCH